MADWKSLQIAVPGKNLLEPARQGLEVLLTLLDVLKALLDTIKVFLVDFGNPVRLLVEALISLIEEMLLSLKVTGVFALFHVPNLPEDPNFENHKGYSAFTEVFKQSLFDTKDTSRPQPRPGSTTGGFVLMLVAADAPFTLLGKVKQLMAFFHKDFASPRYEAPQNLKAAPLGPGGDPILSVAEVFTTNPDQIGLTWDLPSSSETPDAGFNDMLSRVGNEFVPPSYLIEKSKAIDPSAGVIDLAALKNAGTAGRVEHGVEKLVAGTSDPVIERLPLRDIYDDLVIKFTEAIVVETNVISGLLGVFGRMRYVDADVERDVTYYYRVRAFSGSLDVSDKQVNFDAPKQAKGFSEPKVAWPSTSKNPEEICVVGKASSIVAVRLPPLRTGDAASFDVVLNLKRVFQAAFTCDFHRALTSESDADADLPGRASLTRLAGPVASFSAEDLLKQISGSPGTTTKDQLSYLSSVTVLEFPWESRSVRKQSARLADAMASAFLEIGGTVLETFRTLLQASNPVLGKPTLEEATADLTSTEYDDVRQGVSFYNAYRDVKFRRALLEVVTLLRSFAGGGVPPDWISVSPLRDIVPWSGEILYTLLDKIQALVDAFNGVVTELRDFISLLQRKIDTLERLLEQLISVLDFIESLQIGAFVLVVPQIDGTAGDWAREVDSARGAVPPSGPGGYSAGVALSYVAPDVTGLAAAFSLIFGG